MELVKDYTTLIEKLVKANPKYSGNEDLLEDFCSETYQKSYLILQSIENINSLESYLKKVVSSAIMDVLKNNGRITRSTKGYKSIKEISISAESSESVTHMDEDNSQPENNSELNEISETSVDEIVNESTEESFEDNIEESVEEVDTEIYDNNNRHLATNIPPMLSNDLENIKDPRESIEEQIIRKDIIQNIINMVNQINEEKPQEMYLKIFYMRYFQQKKQREIAEETEISQAEISKRLVKLSRLIKEKLY